MSANCSPPHRKNLVLISIMNRTIHSKTTQRPNGVGRAYARLGLERGVFMPRAGVAHSISQLCLWVSNGDYQPSPGEGGA